jgi:putative acetyltransferase
MKIRASTSADQALLLDIWLRSVRASHVFLSELDIQSLLPIVRDQVLPSLRMWVACDADSIPIGFMGVGEGSIEALFIAPDHFGQGAGTMLVEFAKRHLLRPLHVDVNEQNPKAVGFYQARGFEVIGRSPLDGDGRPFPLLHMRECDGRSSRCGPATYI